jgi:NADH-quinone oxidoreductase subunit C
MTSAQTADALKEKFGDAVLSVTEFRGEYTVQVTAETLKPLLQHCRDALAFDYLVDLSTLDHLGQEPRFEVVYELYGYGHLQHLRVKAQIPDDQHPPTVSDIWPTANWHEREAYDMMGVRFEGHPDLRRILMWEGYPYYPLRKDFPLAGKPSDLPEVAFTGIAPLADGPFVTTAGGADTIAREPRAKRVEAP